MSQPVTSDDIEQVEKLMARLGSLTNGGSTLINEALKSAHLAMMQHGAASLTSYGTSTRQVRARTRRRLEAAARAYFLAVMAAEEAIDLT